MTSDEIMHDCLKLIQLKFEGKMNLVDYTAELEFLDKKYPGVGFQQSADHLRAWVAKGLVQPKEAPTK